MMELDDFKQQWKNSPEHPPRMIKTLTSEDVESLREKVDKFNRTIHFRDIRESLIAAFLFFYFIYRAFVEPDMIIQGAHLASAAACVFIIIFMHLKKKQFGRPDPADTLTEYLTKSIKAVEGQIWLLKNVAWWYIIPILASSSIRTILSQNWKSILIVLPSFALIGYAVYYLNKKAVKQTLEPLREQLQGSLDDLDQ